MNAARPALRHCTSVLLALACALPAVPGLAAEEQPGLGRTVELQLPAQPLGDSLTALARVAGLQLAYPPELVAGRTAPAVAGTMDARQALARLLAGSGLEYAPTGDRAVAIQRAAAGGGRPPEVVQGEGVTAVSEGGDGGGMVGYRPETTATAGFGDASVLDTPFSVGVIGSAFARDHVVTSFEDLLTYEPSASANWYSGSYNNFQVRGNQPTILLDGTPFWSRGRMSLTNIERVEFLKGPAALRGGFGGPGGATNFVSKRPTADDRATVGIHGDTWGAVGAALDASTTFADGAVGTRLNVSADHLDNQWDLHGRQYFVSLANDIRLSDHTTLTVDADYMDFSHTYTGEYMTNADGSIADLNPRTLYGQDWNDQIAKTWTGRVGLRQRLAERWTAGIQVGVYAITDTWVSTYMSAIQPNGDYDLEWYGNKDNRRYGFNATGTVNGHLDTGTIGHDLTFAVQHVYASTRDGVSGSSVLGTSNIHAPVAFARPEFTEPKGDKTWQRENHAVATDEIAFTKQWSLLVGGRFSYYHAESQDYSASALVPVGAIIYKPVADVSTYVSYAESLEPGGVAPDGTTNAGEQLDARHSRQGEAGGKAQFFDGDLLLTAAVFRIEAEYWGYTDSSNTYVQDGSQDIVGAELGVVGRVSEGLQLSGGGMILRDKLRDTGNAVYDDNQAPLVPRVRATITADYELPWVRGLAVNGGGSATGRSNFDNWRLGELTNVPGYVTFEAGVRYTTTAVGTPLTARLQVTNLLDKGGTYETLFPIEPATGKLSLEASF